MQWERPPRLFARKALTAQGWQHDTLVTVQETGVIAGVAPGSHAPAGTPSFDLLLPGMPNVHSHAFQRAMAGLTESASPAGNDSFWRWREVMYAFARSLLPDQVRAIAQALYIELLKHGYTAVGEFHYLHHDPAGKPYAVVTELSDQVIAAAQTAGIHITHLPVLYETADFGGVAAHAGQRRFVNTPDHYVALVEALIRRYANTPDVVLGIAPHSLRAVRPESVKAVLSALPGLGLTGCPVHIHVAEQEKEVRDCVAWSGSRPVAWLLDHMPVDRHWCLIHATHVTPQEVEHMASSGGVIGLCPSTEANLGDGVFPAAAYLDARGQFGIGSDSHVGLDPYGELRLLEYGQRLTLRRRAVLSDPTTPSVGHTLYAGAAAGGAQALAIGGGCIAPGRRADLVGMATDDPLLADKEGDQILDTLIFGLTSPTITDVFVGGKRVIKDGVHPRDHESAAALRRTLQAHRTQVVG
jgi:formimidoylglutamate deiminase